MKRMIRARLTAALLAAAVFTGVCTVSAEEQEALKIGVAIASTTDASGSVCKRVLDEAAACFDAQILYVDHGKKAEFVTSAVEQLCKVGCEAIIVCGTADEQIASAIATCEENGVYLAEFFHSVSKNGNTAISEAAKASPYYVGSVREDLFTNGTRLAEMLLSSGSRHIGIAARERNHADTDEELAGVYAAIRAWNSEHPEDKAEYYDPIYAGTTSAGTESVTKQMLSSFDKLDGIIPVRCGQDGTVGITRAIEAAGKKGIVHVVTDVLFPSSSVLLTTGDVIGGAGDNYCDPLYAFMMIYQAVTAKKADYEGKTQDIICPYLYASEPLDVLSYTANFVDDVPYSDEEMEKMAKMSFEELQRVAAEYHLG